MKKFEYEKVTIFDEDDDYMDLNEYGENGWELISTVREPGFFGGGWTDYNFKREID